MKYHSIIDAYSVDVIRQLEEFCAFKNAFLKNEEEGEAYILCREAAEAEKLAECISGKAVVITAKEYSPESVLDVLADEIDLEDLYIFGSGFGGMEICVRLAARTGGSSVTSVHALEMEVPPPSGQDTTGQNAESLASARRVSVRKMVYSNHMEAAFRMNKGPYCVSLAKGMDRQQWSDGGLHILKEIHCESASDFVVSRETVAGESSGGLSEAKVVIAAGRGAGNKENIAMLEEAAEALGGELGVSRPAAMNAWAPMNRLIGVSGAMIKPDICITAGASGAAAFYAGIEKSKFIVAINTDEQAPIMKKADVAVADDFVPVVKALRERAEKQRQENDV